MRQNRHSRWFGWALGAGLGLLLGAPAAWAQGAPPPKEDSKDPEALFFRAEFLQDQHEPEALAAAADLYRAICERAPEHPVAAEAVVRLAECERRLGHKARAREAYRHGLERYRGREDVRRACEDGLRELEAKGGEEPRGDRPRGDRPRGDRLRGDRLRGDRRGPRGPEGREGPGDPDLERHLERMKRALEEAGLSPEEIEARLQRVREKLEREHAERGRRWGGPEEPGERRRFREGRDTEPRRGPRDDEGRFGPRSQDGLPPALARELDALHRELGEIQRRLEDIQRMIAELHGAGGRRGPRGWHHGDPDARRREPRERQEPPPDGHRGPGPEGEPRDAPPPEEPHRGEPVPR